MKSILIIDDECQASARLAKILSRLGYTVYTAESGKEGLDKLALLGPDIVFLDINLGDMSGIDLFIRAIERLRYINKVVHICFMSAKDPSIVNTLPVKPAGYIQKPFTLEELLQVIDQLERSSNER